MGFFNNFPYSNFHELNLDFVLNGYKKAITDAEKALTTSKESEKRVDNALEELPNIVVPETEKAILKLVNDGTIEGVMNLDFVNVKTFGAVGDDVADDSEALQAAFSSGYNLFFPSGIYKVSGEITIESSNVTVVGRNATIKQYEKNTNTIFAQRKTGLEFYNMNFHQVAKANLPGSIEYALRFTNCKNIVVDNCYFYNFVSGFVCDYVEAEYNENIVVRNCRFEKYNFAILPSQYRNMVIDGCSGVGVENTHINKDGVTMDPPHLVYSTDRASVLVPESLFIINCAEFANTYDCPFKVRNIKGLTMVNCQAIDCNRGLEIASASDVVVQGFVANLVGSTDGSAAGIYLYDVKGCTFANINVNCAESARKYCIRLTKNLTDGNKDVVFSNINFVANNTSQKNLIPITLQYSDNVTINGFTYHETGGYFRRIVRCEDVRVDILNFVVRSDIFDGYRIIIAEANNAADVINAVVAPILFPVDRVEITNTVGATANLVLIKNYAEA